MPTRVIAIVGMPGSGKSTLATTLAEMFNVTAISGGDVARRIAETNKEVADALERGEFAPKELMNAEMRKIVGRAILDDAPIILEGYPRYQEQMDDLLRVTDGRVGFVLIGCNDDTARKRLFTRMRSDDTHEAIDARILNYWAETYPTFADIPDDRFLFIPVGTKQDAVNRAADYLTANKILSWPTPISTQGSTTSSAPQSASAT